MPKVVLFLLLTLWGPLFFFLHKSALTQRTCVGGYYEQWENKHGEVALECQSSLSSLPEVLWDQLNTGVPSVYIVQSTCSEGLCGRVDAWALSLPGAFMYGGWICWRCPCCLSCSSNKGSCVRFMMFLIWVLIHQYCFDGKHISAWC